MEIRFPLLPKLQQRFRKKPNNTQKMVKTLSHTIHGAVRFITEYRN